MNIKYILYAAIDKVKWDACVKQARCTHPYALSAYLDATTESKWNALVLGDYEVVMPLAVRQKMGVQYLYQPFYSQQLGIYSLVAIDESIEQAFINAIPRNFSYIDIQLNYTHPVSLNQKCNLILDLNHPKEELYANYSNNLKRNIQKALQQPLQWNKCDETHTYLTFAKQVMLEEQQSIYSTAIYASLERLTKMLFSMGIAQIYQVRYHDEICTMMLLIEYRNRLINLAPLTTNKGKEVLSSPFLYHQLIQQYAGTPIYFDFEGSEIKGVKQFYKQFGATEENYPILKINRLPIWMRWLKK
ncbi:MAG: hypothetical protein WCP57_00215 [Bacteroidota bacterium]